MGAGTAKLARRFPLVLDSSRSVNITSKKLVTEISEKLNKVVPSIVVFTNSNCNQETNLGNSSILRAQQKPSTSKISADGSINTQASKGWSKPSVSNIYEQTRPDYNTESVEFLLEKTGALQVHSESSKFTIAELGAGTGKFTRAVLRVLQKNSIKNVEIISTEPVKKMCEKFKEMVPSVEILQCPANDLSLASSSVDAVLAAQCFHWFSNAESVSEIHRLLKPKGMLGIIWNLPDRSISWIKPIEEMLDVKYRKYGIARPETKEWLRQINNHGGFGPLNEDDSYQYITNFNFEGLIERFKSISVIAAAENNEREKMLAMIENEIKTNSDVKDQENLTFEYVVEIKWFQKN